MLDILILYSLHKQEQTFYGLSKTIAEHFGEISIPSHGALHPALRKLTENNFLSIRKKISNGGKRYTYYAINDSFQEIFNHKFMKINYAKTETLESFLLGLKARIYTFNLLDKALIEDFKEKMILKLNKYENEISQKIKNEYIELNEIQKKICEIYLKEIGEYRNIIKDLS